MSAAGIARRGLIRVGLFPSFFYTRETDGTLTGWGIEMAGALARRLGVELQLVERASPPDVVASIAAGDCDTAFLGISKERAAEVDFTPPWVRAEFTFLVPAGSGWQRIGELDKTGLRIAVVARHAMDNALAGQLPRAQRIYADTPDAAFGLVMRGEADVLAGIRPGLMAYAARAPGARVLADAYGANVIGLAVRKGETAWRDDLGTFVEESKANGDARAAAERVGAHGLDVAA